MDESDTNKDESYSTMCTIYYRGPITKIASNFILKEKCQLANNSQLDDASPEPEIIFSQAQSTNRFVQ